MPELKKQIRTFILFILATGSSLMGYSQGYYLKGYMGVQGGESFNYVVYLKDSTDNQLTGYSLTFSDADTTKKVKTYLTAEVDRKEQTLHLHEHKILDNNGFQSHASICLVNALLKWDPKEESLSGNLITKTMTYGLNCSTGSIALINEPEINKLFSEQTVDRKTAPNTITSSNSEIDPNKKLRAYFLQQEKEGHADKQTATTQPIAAEAPQPQVKRITEGEDGVYVWHSNEIRFEIWDGGEIDNDIVTVNYNGAVILNNYSLTADKKKLIFKIGNKALNTITITANNEGASPPNTADIILTDGTKTYTLQAYNSTGKSAIIKIKRAQN